RAASRPRSTSTSSTPRSWWTSSGTSRATCRPTRWPRSTRGSASAGTTSPSPSAGPDPAGPAPLPPSSRARGAGRMTVTDNRAAQRAPSPGARQDPRAPRTRLEAFFDEGSLHLLTAEDGGAVLAGAGRIGGMPAVAFANDARIQGGAMGAAGCAAIEAGYAHALRERAPVVGLWHSGGARLAEGVEALHAVGRVFAVMTRASGVVPQVSVVLGPAAGGAAYGPALTDAVVMSERGRLFVTGPDVVRSVTGEEITAEELGGADAHGRRSGVVHLTAPDDTAALVYGRELALLLGDQGRLRTDRVDERDLSHVLPA